MTLETLSQPLNESPDYGHALEFGYFLTPDASDPLGVLETARLADGLAYDLIGVQDHPYQPRHLDTFSLLAAILAQTACARVFADVANLPLRPPAVLAKAAATLDLLSGGRFELGIGAGGYLEAAHAMGAPALTVVRSRRMCAWTASSAWYSQRPRAVSGRSSKAGAVTSTRPIVG